MTPYPVSLWERWALERAARCPDCDSRARLTAYTPGVLILEVRHDDTCPTYRAMHREETIR